MFAEGLLQLCVPQEQSIEKQDWGWQTGSLQNRVSVSPSPGSTEAGGGSAPSFSLLMSTRDLSPKSLMQARMSRAGQTVAALTWSPSLSLTVLGSLLSSGLIGFYTTSGAGLHVPVPVCLQASQAHQLPRFHPARSSQQRGVGAPHMLVLLEGDLRGKLGTWPTSRNKKGSPKTRGPSAAPRRVTACMNVDRGRGSSLMSFPWCE
jgi:hypothetical protein